MNSFPGEEWDRWQQTQPTPEELFLSGGLQMEDWPHARQETQPHPLPVASTLHTPRQKIGHTQAQYRWGRQSFSPRMLCPRKQCKKMKHTHVCTSVKELA